MKQNEKAKLQAFKDIRKYLKIKFMFFKKDNYIITPKELDTKEINKLNEKLKI